MKRDLIYLTLLAALFAAAKVMARNDRTTSRQELTPVPSRWDSRRPCISSSRRP